MKKFSKAAVPMTCSAVLWLVVSLIPLIPTEYSPVVPDPIPRSTFISILGLFASSFLCGVSYRATWATLPVMVGLSAAAIVAGWKLGRRLASRS